MKFCERHSQRYLDDGVCTHCYTEANEKKKTPADIPSTTRIENGVTVVTLHPGALVFCDLCGEDWTERTESGGILVVTKAICPACTPKYEADLIRYREQHLIRSRCPAGQSYADWVRGLR